MLFARAYPRETQEMVFDAHDRAFALFKGTCGRGIYDNMKTAVETVFVGKGRVYNRRFLQMCSHYLVEPVACTPDILADAAYLIFAKPAESFTGQFLIDDTFLAGEGITDFDAYRVDPSQPLSPDFFVPDSSKPPPGVSLAAKA